MPVVARANHQGYLCPIAHAEVYKRLSRQGDFMIWYNRSRLANHLEPQLKRKAAFAKALVAMDRIFGFEVQVSKRQRGPDIEDMVFGWRTFEEGLMCQAAPVTPPVEFTESEEEEEEQEAHARQEAHERQEAYEMQGG